MNASDKVKIGQFTLKNRITMAPTVKFDYTDETGNVTDKYIEHYRKRALGGFGLICVEATAVLPGGRFGKNHMGLWADSQIDGHKAITTACHDAGAIAIIQLNHVGVSANPECGPSVGPSTLELEGYKGKYISHGMDRGELMDMQKAYIKAAVRAREAGYDGVQLHACHGYLLNQFISVNHNKRDDEYGGTASNRARFTSEIIKEIRFECGNDFLISARTTGLEPTLADGITVAEKYLDSGCDYLQVSTGMTDLNVLAPYKDEMIDAVRSLGIRFKDYFKDTAVISCVGGINSAEMVNHILQNNMCDTVDIGRAALADPSFAAHVLNNEPIKKCFGCPNCQYGPFTKHNCPAGGGI